MNIDIGDDGSVKVSASAYVKAKAEFYLPKSLAEYPRFDTPPSAQGVKDYETADSVDPAFQNKYQSKLGALIYAPPCGRPESRSP
eukprot:869791-Pleurochrysis_carterae.AAC.2